VDVHKDKVDMPKLLFVRPLLEEEKQALEQIMAGQNRALKQRALIVLLSAEDRYRVPEIAPMVGLHVDKVRKWVVRFNRSGLKGLQPPRRKPGPRGKFDSDVRKTIISISSTPPRQLGLLRTTWTLDSLREYLIANDVVAEISRESLRQILVQGNVNWQRYRPRSSEVSRWLQQWKSGAPN
jgi:transposase